jgi:hypothetical protein
VPDVVHGLVEELGDVVVVEAVGDASAVTAAGDQATGAQQAQSVAFTPDGKTLAVVHGSADIGLWDADPQHVIADLCNAVGDPISEQDWKKYLPDRPYQPPCP